MSRLVNIYRVPEFKFGHTIERLYALTSNNAVYEQPARECRPGSDGIPRHGWTRTADDRLPQGCKHVGQFYVDMGQS